MHSSCAPDPVLPLPHHLPHRQPHRGCQTGGPPGAGFGACSNCACGGQHRERPVLQVHCLCTHLPLGRGRCAPPHPPASSRPYTWGAEAAITDQGAAVDPPPTSLSKPRNAPLQSVARRHICRTHEAVAHNAQGLLAPALPLLRRMPHRLCWVRFRGLVGIMMTSDLAPPLQVY